MNAAPVTGTTTIVVCPGIYTEQVQIIGKSIILKGISYAGSDSAIIAASAGGLVANAKSTFRRTRDGGDGACAKYDRHD